MELGAVGEGLLIVLCSWKGRWIQRTDALELGRGLRSFVAEGVIAGLLVSIAAVHDTPPNGNGATVMP